MMSKAKILLLVLLCSLSFTACYRVPNKLEPQINYVVQDKYIRSLETSFPPLDKHEQQQEWGKEYFIGVAFAKKLDLYRAVTAFKRAEILLPDGLYHRKQEVEYYIILSYYLGKRYEEAIDAFDDSDLRIIDTKFPTYHDLLVILYECYTHTDQKDKATNILNIVKHHYPETAKELELSTALIFGDLDDIKKLSYDTTTKDSTNQLLAEYQKEKKSLAKAQGFNALLPGAGYLYVGQKQSALTAVLLNGIFIAAATHFFLHHHTAAGIIFTSFEAGWYFGGIYGAGEAAKLYNERVYEGKAFNTLNQNKLFPIFMLRYGF
jgi:tetratricopeptide (TPR) repeat protein